MYITENKAKLKLVKTLLEEDIITFEESLLLLEVEVKTELIPQPYVNIPYTYTTVFQPGDEDKTHFSTNA